MRVILTYINDDEYFEGRGYIDEQMKGNLKDALRYMSNQAIKEILEERSEGEKKDKKNH